MKKILIIAALICLFIYSNRLYAQSNRTITISGYLSDEYLRYREADFNGVVDTPEVSFYNEYNPQLYHEADVIPIIIKNNRFVVKVDPRGKIGYFVLNGFHLHGIFSNIFLVAAGDSVCINSLNNNEVIFTGKGATVLNYQLWVGKQFDINSKKFMNNSVSESVPYYKMQANSRLKLALDSLEKYKSMWGDTIYQILRINTASAVNANYLLHIKYNNSVNVDSAYKEFFKQELITQMTNQSGFALSDPYLIRNAFLYNYDLYTTISYYWQLISDRIYAPFSDVYSTIKSLYSGLLRDKLITNSFLALARTSNTYTYLNDALNVITDSSCRKVLENMQAKMPGVKAFDFKFEGMNGKMINLSDFKGKVVVVDTWFNGCPGCIALAEKLEPIEDSYSKNKDIVFLGINVDKDRKKFLDGVKSGLYGSKETIYAFTNGLGQYHPMLLHYNYYEYPNLLIIDKEGNIVSASPPLPFDEGRKKQFLKLIDESL